MALIIIGFIVFLLGLAIVRNNEWNYRYRRFSAPARIIGGIIMLIGILTSCIVQIEAGEVGVKKTVW